MQQKKILFDKKSHYATFPHFHEVINIEKNELAEEKKL